MTSTIPSPCRRWRKRGEAGDARMAPKSGQHAPHNAVRQPLRLKPFPLRVQPLFASRRYPLRGGPATLSFRSTRIDMEWLLVSGDYCRLLEWSRRGGPRPGIQHSIVVGGKGGGWRRPITCPAVKTRRQHFATTHTPSMISLL